ncbi:hypothetical protein PFISCL1PPCAC_4312, partial [Pristionchus fissidentatus]
SVLSCTRCTMQYGVHCPNKFPVVASCGCLSFNECDGESRLPGGVACCRDFDGTVAATRLLDLTPIATRDFRRHQMCDTCQMFVPIDFAPVHFMQDSMRKCGKRVCVECLYFNDEATHSHVPARD